LVKKVALSIVALAAVLFGLVAPAAASPQYPPSGLEVTVTDPTPSPGGTFSVTATGCAEGDTVTFSFNGETQTAVVSGGSATVSFTAPTTPGSYTGTVTCSGVAGDFGIVVPSSGGTLPATGSDGIAGTTVIAIGLLGVGLGLFAVATFRRRQTTS
jgi:LPXTG-motif cell wall-anchored protein